jgi:hypothetical protein
MHNWTITVGSVRNQSRHSHVGLGVRGATPSLEIAEQRSTEMLARAESVDTFRWIGTEAAKQIRRVGRRSARTD